MLELLCPAGNREALIAAVRNGADAVYLGGMALNARRGAGNFDRDGLRWACDFAHERDVRIYVTVNTLVKQSEMHQLSDIANQLEEAHADAAIVQDIGAAQMLRKLLPTIEIHASTQMAVHNRSGVRFCYDMGYDRVVLAREMTDQDIAACADIGPELEVFAHGALCVACSGQCLFSSLVGGRSGNRGMCAQPCRLPYQLNGESGYLLSPKDLMQLSRLRELEQLGVKSVKIEGRLKRPEYVAIVTSIYREMIDNPHVPTAKEIEALRQIFNRGGFTKGYGARLIDSELTSREKPNHCGVTVGEMIGNGKAQLARDISTKDQVIVDDEPIKLSGKAGETVPVNSRAKLNAPIIRLADDEQLRAARETYEGAEQPRFNLEGDLKIQVGEPMLLSVTHGDLTVRAKGQLVERAQNRASDNARIRSQIEKTGGTPYTFSGLNLDIAPDAFVPVSALNELRRDALSQLTQARIAKMRSQHKVHNPRSSYPAQNDIAQKAAIPAIRLQSDDMGMLETAMDLGISQLIYAPSDVTIEGLQLVRPKFAIILALPMVCSEISLLALHEWAWRHEQMINGVLAANVAHTHLQWPGELAADYSINAANNETISLLQDLNIRSYAASVELTA